MDDDAISQQPWPEQMTLSALVDGLGARFGQRDRELVRALSAWLHRNADRLALPMVERLGLTDVVLTLQMREDVSLVVTGSHPELPGEVTVKVAEGAFPQVALSLRPEPTADPYTMCTLDYGPAGRIGVLVRSVDERYRRYEAGESGRCQVVSTIGPEQFVRLLMAGDPIPLNAPAASVRLLE